MRLSYAIRGALTALTVTAAALATAAYADSGSIRFNVVKAGFVVGAFCRRRDAAVSRPALSPLDRRDKLWLYLRRFSNRFCRHRQQHPKAL